MERSTTQRVDGGNAAATRQPGGCFQPPAAVLAGPLGQGLAVVARISEDEVQALKALLGQLLQGCFAAHPVVFLGWDDVRGQPQAAGVDDELALAALDFFVAVKAFVCTTPQ